MNSSRQSNFIQRIAIKAWQRALQTNWIATSSRIVAAAFDQAWLIFGVALFAVDRGDVVMCNRRDQLEDRQAGALRLLEGGKKSTRINQLHQCVQKYKGTEILCLMRLVQARKAKPVDARSSHSRRNQFYATSYHHWSLVGWLIELIFSSRILLVAASRDSRSPRTALRPVGSCKADEHLHCGIRTLGRLVYTDTTSSASFYAQLGSCEPNGFSLRCLGRWWGQWGSKSL